MLVRGMGTNDMHVNSGKLYCTWQVMLQNVSEGFTVTPYWLKLSNFAKWYSEQEFSQKRLIALVGQHYSPATVVVCSDRAYGLLSSLQRPIHITKGATGYRTHVVRYHEKPYTSRHQSMRGARRDYRRVKRNEIEYLIDSEPAISSVLQMLLVIYDKETHAWINRVD